MDSYYDDGGCCIVHPDSTDLILTGGRGPLTQTNWSFVVSYSRDGGTKWTRCNPTPDSAGFCRALAVAPSQTNIIYAGGDVAGKAAVYISTDFGSTWTQTATAPTDTVFSLDVDPTDAARVLAATPAGAFLTTNSGATWTNLHGGNLRAVLMYPGCPDTLIAGGVSGVSISTDSGNTWHQMSAGLDGREVTALAFVNDGGTYLIAGTVGGSCYAWQFESGIAERPALQSGHMRPSATVIRRVLNLPRPLDLSIPSVLLDISGRKVMDLRPGANDVHALAPGVYFVCLSAGGKTSTGRLTLVR
jgi:hypothetical protein